MQRGNTWLGLTGLVLLIVTPGSAWAQARVELELVTGQRVSITAQQEWLRRLAEAGVTNVRIHAAQEGDAPSIDNLGSDAAPSYAVKGVIVADDMLVVPGRRFRIGELKQFNQWLADLARHGPEQKRPQKTAFGLDVEQYRQVQDDLASPVGFSTEGLTRQEVVEKIAKQLQLPLEHEASKLQAADDKVTEDLSSLSRGTALAYVLRPIGVCLVPHAAASGVKYTLVDASDDVQPWPVGWKPERPERELTPVMFEFLNVNVQNVAATEVLKAVSKRADLPVLWDYNALARHGVEPEKTVVNLPSSRTTYSLMLRKTLFQARLKSEVRTDEAGKPFLWITTLKPLP